MASIQVTGMHVALHVSESTHSKSAGEEVVHALAWRHEGAGHAVIHR